MGHSHVLSGEEDPADGSVFGWPAQGTVTAIVIFYAPGEHDGGGWSLCPRADVPESQWPGRGEPPGGYLAEGMITSIEHLIGDTRNMVFWVPATRAQGEGIIAVAADIPADPRGGRVLPRGRYAHCTALRSAASLPSLGDLLADSRRVDLGPACHARTAMGAP